MVGTSSTAREMFGVLTVVQRWGATARDRTVRIVLDSQTATRNIDNGGGPVKMLSNIAKQIWEEAEEARITIRPQWVPREENTFADQLSKRWDNWFRLGTAAERAVRKLMKSYGQPLQLLNIPFAQIQNAVAKIAADRSVACIVHPRWVAQSWWKPLDSHTRARIELGTADAVLTPRAGDPIPSPRWILLASIVAFDAQPKNQ